MEKTIKTTKAAAKTKVGTPKYNKRKISAFVHFAGIPCMDGISKPIIDATYTYRKENVTCKECQKAIR